MLYRILTEDKNREQVLKLVARYLLGATVMQGRGLWREQWENSLIIETDADYEAAVRLAIGIKTLNRQDAVLIQQIDCESYLI